MPFETVLYVGNESHTVSPSEDVPRLRADVARSFDGDGNWLIFEAVDGGQVNIYIRPNNMADPVVRIIRTPRD